MKTEPGELKYGSKGLKSARELQNEMSYSTYTNIHCYKLILLLILHKKNDLKICYVSLQKNKTVK